MVLLPILSLCSGIGGLDIGLQLALGGATRIVCYVEHELSACEIIAQRIAEAQLDDAPIWTDVRTFDGRKLRGKVAGITAGYPCQPFSIAGKKLGTKDPRHLWPDIRRITWECEPGFVFLENVPNHLTMGFDVVSSDLSGMGYRVEAGLFAAAEVGAPHVRQRLFVIAFREGDSAWETARQKALEISGSIGWRGWAGDESAAPGAYQACHTSSELADTDVQRGCGWQAWRKNATDAFPAIAAMDCGVSLFPPGPNDFKQWEWIINKFPEFSPALEPAVCGVADGLSPGLDFSWATRLRLLGNAVVPVQAAYAFSYLVERSSECAE